MSIEGTAPLTAADRAAIRSLIEDEWTQARADAADDRVVEMCTEDVVYMPHGQPPVRGRDELRAFLQRFPRVLSAEQPVERIEGYGDFAVVHARFSITVAGAGGPEQVKGRVVGCLRKQADGRWRCESAMLNRETP